MRGSIFGWDLPPGCTTQDIENAYGCEAPPLEQCDYCGAFLTRKPLRYREETNKGKPCAFGSRCPDGGDAIDKARDGKTGTCEACAEIEGYGATIAIWVCRKCGQTVERVW